MASPPVLFLLLLISAVSDSLKLSVLVLLPHRKQDYAFPFGAEMSGAAVLTAFEDIKSQQLLPGVELEAVYADTQCSSLNGIGMAYEMLHMKNFSVVIGPQCSQVCRFVGRLAAYLDIPCFSGVCQDVEMSNKKEFKTLTRFLGTFEMTGFAVSRFLQRFRWRRVGIIAQQQTDFIWMLTKDGLHYALKEDGLEIELTTLVTSGSDLRQVMLKMAKVSRVIILAVHGDVLRELMLVASDLGYTNGDYVYICVKYYKQTRLFGDFGWKRGDKDDTTARLAYRSLFYLSYFNRDTSSEYLQFIENVKNRSATEFGYIYTDGDEVPYPAANLYEATYLYAVAINETLSTGGDPKNGIELSQRLWGRTFPSVTGELTLNDNGDREQAYTLHHIQDHVTGTSEAIAHYRSSDRSFQDLTSDITWHNHSWPPPDTPPCGFDGQLCIETEYARMLRLTVIYASVLGGVVLVALLLVVLLFRRMRWLREVADMKWRIPYEDIVLTHGNSMGSSIFAEKQMSRASLSNRLSSNLSKVSRPCQRFMKTGSYKGVTIAMKPISHVQRVDLSDQGFLQEMKRLHDLNHPNLARFVGATTEYPNIYIISDYCDKGSLQDVLENDDIQLDWAFKVSLINDIMKGLEHLCSSFLHFHGNLKSSNCVVDGRFVVKLTDFGLEEWNKGPNRGPKDLLWTAPELLGGPLGLNLGDRRPRATREGDVYAVGILMQEIIAREGPFYVQGFDGSAEEKLERVNAKEDPPFRPTLSDADCPKELIKLIKLCWSEDQSERPVLKDLRKQLAEAGVVNQPGTNIMDNLLQRMEQYANNLEDLVTERTDKYLEEKKKAEDLLHKLLPRSVADELQGTGRVCPVAYDCVTIYFSDIVEFTNLCAASSPMDVVNLLNDLYTAFDGIIARYDVYKVETIGDAYMAVSGLPVENGTAHASEIASMALNILYAVKSFKISHLPSRQLLARIGIHSGPCVAGVVGRVMPRYCLFGDTVNTASRMESTGEALKIHISEPTYELLLRQGGYEAILRGNTAVKGKGFMKTYWLLQGPKTLRSAPLTIKDSLTSMSNHSCSNADSVL